MQSNGWIMDSWGFHACRFFVYSQILDRKYPVAKALTTCFCASFLMVILGLTRCGRNRTSIRTVSGLSQCQTWTSMILHLFACTTQEDQGNLQLASSGCQVWHRCRAGPFAHHDRLDAHACGSRLPLLHGRARRLRSPAMLRMCRPCRHDGARRNQLQVHNCDLHHGRCCHPHGSHAYLPLMGFLLV